VQLYGTDPRYVGKAVEILCAEYGVRHVDLNFGCPVPKVTRKGGGGALEQELRVDVLKGGIGVGEKVADVGQGTYTIPVYVQPMDVHDPIRNAANLKRAATLAQTQGYRLSLQTHKIVGIA
jgi:hypothetical protein